MKAKQLSLLVLGAALALSIVSAGCRPAPVSSATSEPSAAAPGEVVERFYEWYVDYPGNPLADGAYRSSEYLAGEFVQKVDGIIASFDQGGYDPFLCAQDVPASFTIEPATVSGDEASVVMHEIWNPGTEVELVHDLTVTLRIVDGAWKIVGITCSDPQPVALPPEQVVRGFYDWYLGYIGDPAVGEMRNPLVDGAYRSSEYLAREFVQKVDQIVASFDKGGYDPFLCAQDVPRSFTVDAAAVSGDEASVVVHEIWNPGTKVEAVYDVTVALRMVDGVWKIVDVACGGQESAFPMPEGPIPVTPEGPVAGFYSWYIWYARNVGNPLADGVYRSSEYLTEEFVQKVDGIISSFDKGGYDPFLCAQDVPESFTVADAVMSGDQASLVVHTSFEGHAFTVEVSEMNGRWAISDVICAEAGAAPEEATGDARVAGWQVFADAEYGFHVRYPGDWVYEDTPPVPEGMQVPESQKALKRVLFFAPQGWDGVAPPLHVHVTEGTAEEFGLLYVPATSSESLEIGGRAVVREIEGLGDEVQVIRYVFQSPVAESVRIVAFDYISGFPERAAGHEGVIEVVEQILATVEFTS
jgi:hypothetical protein